MHTAWLQGHLSAVGYHAPKDYPKSASDLMPKHESKKMNTAEQWAAIFAGLLGEPVEIKTKIHKPTDDEVKHYG